MSTRFKKKQSKSVQPKELPATALVYKGPTQKRNDKTASTLSTVVMVNTSTISSSAGGVISNVFSSDPTVSENWADASGLFDEYRVLSMQIKYFPNDRYDPGLTQHQRPLIVVADHNGNATLSSYALAANYSSSNIRSTGDPWTKSLNMEGVGEATFVNTSTSPSDLFYIKVFSSGLAVSSEYGRFFQYYRVQFRSHGV